jgi:signal transduction histidine kinase
VTKTRASWLLVVFKVVLVGAICHVSTQIGFAHKFPPHYISPLWPTGAILFSVLVVTPMRHWGAYIVAGYFTSVLNDARAGFPPSALLFVVAGIVEILMAALGVRRFAGGVRAFDSLRNLVAYILIAVVFAPILSAFIGAFAGGNQQYWFYWRVWLLSEALAFLTLAPAALTLIGAASNRLPKPTLIRVTEACLVFGALVAIGVRVFAASRVPEQNVPALVYLLLPLLLWAAVRFGPGGLSASLMIVASLSISGAVQGRGPFGSHAPSENMLSLQLFLLAMALPLMFLVALVSERRRSEAELHRSYARIQDLAGRLISAQESERTRIARELHDDVSQQLALLSVELQQLGNELPAHIQDLRARTRELWDQSNAIAVSVHDLSHQLHPLKLDVIGLVPAIASLRSEMTAHHGLAIAFRHQTISGAIPRDVALCVYRIVQEGLRNAIKHSGAREVTVDLTGNSDGLALTIADDGAGFDADADEHEGLGLASMRERLEPLGGTLRICSKPGAGTRIEVTVPLVSAAAAAGAAL